MRVFTGLMKSFAALLVAAPLVSCSGLGGSSTSALECGDHCGEEQPPAEDEGCTLTQGYWKNHEEAWPVASLTLGTVSYAKAELLVILRTPVRGNGLVSLAHQLIAAKLNIAAGASDGDIADAIADADAIIGSLVVGEDSLATSATAALVMQLDGFNNGKSGPGHCDDSDQDSDSDSDGGGDCDGDSDSDSDHDNDSDSEGGGDCGGEEPPPGPACGNGTVEEGENCDDGNVANGDGCSSTCTVETVHQCVCGDGILDSQHGEACDDGNTTSGDGCSATCTVEAPVCGNDIVEPGEACDDGNTADHDGCSPTCQIETNPCQPC